MFVTRKKIEYEITCYNQINKQTIKKKEKKTNKKKERLSFTISLTIKYSYLQKSTSRAAEAFHLFSSVSSSCSEDLY